MKNLIKVVALTTPLLLLSACTTVETVAVDNVVYDPGYTDNYVYSVGYYYNRPYWGNNYYYYNGYNWGGTRYWGGAYYNGY